LLGLSKLKLLWQRTASAVPIGGLKDSGFSPWGHWRVPLNQFRHLTKQALAFASPREKH
jgi:hypothetical protein